MFIIQSTTLLLADVFTTRIKRQCNKAEINRRKIDIIIMQSFIYEIISARALRLFRAHKDDRNREYDVIQWRT